MKLGDKCRILECNEDDNANLDYQGMIGTIVGPKLHHTCGEVLNDLLITVEFEDGTRDGFWYEEIEVLP